MGAEESGLPAAKIKGSERVSAGRPVARPTFDTLLAEHEGEIWIQIVAGKNWRVVDLTPRPMNKPQSPPGSPETKRRIQFPMARVVLPHVRFPLYFVFFSFFSIPDSLFLYFFYMWFIWENIVICYLYYDMKEILSKIVWEVCTEFLIDCTVGSKPARQPARVTPDRQVRSQPEPRSHASACSHQKRDRSCRPRRRQRRARKLRFFIECTCHLHRCRRILLSHYNATLRIEMRIK